MFYMLYLNKQESAMEKVQVCRKKGIQSLSKATMRPLENSLLFFGVTSKYQNLD